MEFLKKQILFIFLGLLALSPVLSTVYGQEQHTSVSFDDSGSSNSSRIFFAQAFLSQWAMRKAISQSSISSQPPKPEREPFPLQEIPEADVSAKQEIPFEQQNPQGADGEAERKNQDAAGSGIMGDVLSEDSRIPLPGTEDGDKVYTQVFENAAPATRSILPQATGDKEKKSKKNEPWNLFGNKGPISPSRPYGHSAQILNIKSDSRKK